MIAREIVEAIAISNQLISIGRQIGNCVPHGVDQPEAYNVFGPACIRHWQAKVTTRGLESPDNGTGRIQQSTIPIENNQFVFHCFVNMESKWLAVNSRLFLASTAAI